MNTGDLFSAIGSFGFPIVVAWYLLTRVEKKLENIEKNQVEILTYLKTLLKRKSL